MENTENQTFLFTDEMKAVLNETRKWTMFIAILGFIGIGFFIIASLFVGTLFNMAKQPLPFPSIYLTVLYILLGIIYFFPFYYLYRFSVKAKDALRTGLTADLSLAFINLKSHYKFLGILCIIVLSFYVLAFIVGIVGGTMMF